jgi:murein L,D-transpeptidase YcbB/YkuD
MKIWPVATVALMLGCGASNPDNYGEYTTLLERGTSGRSVSRLRTALIEQGYLDHRLPLSDQFDSNLESAVKQFQVNNGMRPTGKVCGVGLDLIYGVGQ